MRIKSITTSRFTTVVVAGAVVALLGAGAGYSAGQITTHDIKNHTILKKDLNTKTVAKLRGNSGPAGPAGPQGGSNVVQVKNLTGQWTIRSTDTAGAKMTGDGIQFGPFASPGTCSTDGVDYARLDFSGLNGTPLSSLTNLDLTALYRSDTPTGGVGVPAVRIFFSGTGTGGDAVPNEPNRLTFSPNTQPEPDVSEGALHTWMVTSGNVRYNDDGGNAPAQEKAWAFWVSQFPGATISNINVLDGCSAGTNLTTILREFQINGTHYEFGS